MNHSKPLPAHGDFITLEAPRYQSAVAICVGHTRAGALRVRQVTQCNAHERRSTSRGFQAITTYRGAWRELPVTDPRHPAFDPAPAAVLAELGL